MTSFKGKKSAISAYLHKPAIFMNIKVSSSLLLAKEFSGKYGEIFFSDFTEVLWRAPCLIRIKRCGSSSRIAPLVSPDRGCCSIKTIKTRQYFFRNIVTYIFSQKRYV